MKTIASSILCKDSSVLDIDINRIRFIDNGCLQWTSPDIDSGFYFNENDEILRRQNPLRLSESEKDNMLCLNNKLETKVSELVNQIIRMQSKIVKITNARNNRLYRKIECNVICYESRREFLYKATVEVKNEEFRQWVWSRFYGVTYIPRVEFTRNIIEPVKDETALFENISTQSFPISLSPKARAMQKFIDSKMRVKVCDPVKDRKPIGKPFKPSFNNGESVIRDLLKKDDIKKKSMKIKTICACEYCPVCLRLIHGNPKIRSCVKYHGRCVSVKVTDTVKVLPVLPLLPYEILYNIVGYCALNQSENVRLVNKSFNGEYCKIQRKMLTEVIDNSSVLYKTHPVPMFDPRGETKYTISKWAHHDVIRAASNVNGFCFMLLAPFAPSMYNLTKFPTVGSVAQAFNNPTNHPDDMRVNFSVDHKNGIIHLTQAFNSKNNQDNLASSLSRPHKIQNDYCFVKLTTVFNNFMGYKMGGIVSEYQELYTLGYEDDFTLSKIQFLEAPIQDDTRYYDVHSIMPTIVVETAVKEIKKILGSLENYEFRPVNKDLVSQRENMTSEYKRLCLLIAVLRTDNLPVLKELNSLIGGVTYYDESKKKIVVNTFLYRSLKSYQDTIGKLRSEVSTEVHTSLTEPDPEEVKDKMAFNPITGNYYMWEDDEKSSLSPLQALQQQLAGTGDKASEMFEKIMEDQPLSFGIENPIEYIKERLECFDRPYTDDNLIPKFLTVKFKEENATVKACLLIMIIATIGTHEIKQDYDLRARLLSNASVITKRKLYLHGNFMEDMVSFKEQINMEQNQHLACHNLSPTTFPDMTEFRKKLDNGESPEPESQVEFMYYMMHTLGCIQNMELKYSKEFAEVVHKQPFGDPEDFASMQNHWRMFKKIMKEKFNNPDNYKSIHDFCIKEGPHSKGVVMDFCDVEAHHDTEVNPTCLLDVKDKITPNISEKIHKVLRLDRAACVSNIISDPGLDDIHTSRLHHYLVNDAPSVNDIPCLHTSDVKAPRRMQFSEAMHKRICPILREECTENCLHHDFLDSIHPDQKTLALANHDLYGDPSYWVIMCPECHIIDVCPGSGPTEKHGAPDPYAFYYTHCPRGHQIATGNHKYRKDLIVIRKGNKGTSVPDGNVDIATSSLKHSNMNCPNYPPESKCKLTHIPSDFLTGSDAVIKQKMLKKISILEGVIDESVRMTKIEVHTIENWKLVHRNNVKKSYKIPIGHWGVYPDTENTVLSPSNIDTKERLMPITMKGNKLAHRYHKNNKNKHGNSSRMMLTVKGLARAWFGSNFKDKTLIENEFMKDSGVMLALCEQANDKTPKNVGKWEPRNSLDKRILIRELFEIARNADMADIEEDPGPDSQDFQIRW